MSSQRSALKRLTTGSTAFDRILDGGIPIRSRNLIAGPPGAGKTLFSLQTTILQGGTGIGKTLLGLQFLLESEARRAGHPPPRDS